MPTPPRTQPINVPAPAPGSQSRSLNFPFLGNSNSGNEKYGTSFPRTTPSPQAQNSASEYQGKEGRNSGRGINIGKPKFDFENRIPKKRTGPKPTHPTIVTNGTILPNFLEKGHELLPAKAHTKQDNVSNYSATGADWSKAAGKLTDVKKKWTKGHKRGSSSENSGREKTKITLKPRLSPDQQH